MKIIIAPDSFKGCMSARQAAEAMEHGVHHVLPDAECVLVPMADGGEGTVQSLVDATGGTLLEATVTGPLGTPVHAQYGMLGDGCTAVIEMAAASGIGYVDETTRDPRITTTYGVGELILDALDHGATAFILGLGGSATNDGGAGMAQALGAHLLDAQGNELPFGGAALAGLAAIDVSDLDSRIATADIRLASDVTNPLTGPQGASSVFGPQKAPMHRWWPNLMRHCTITRRLWRAILGVTWRPCRELAPQEALELDSSHSLARGCNRVCRSWWRRPDSRRWRPVQIGASPAKAASTARRNTAKRRSV